MAVVLGVIAGALALVVHCFIVLAATKVPGLFAEPVFDVVQFRGDSGEQRVALTDYLGVVWADFGILTEDAKRELVRIWGDRATRVHLADWFRGVAIVNNDFASENYPRHYDALRKLAPLTTSTVLAYREELALAKLAVETNHVLAEKRRFQQHGAVAPASAAPILVAFHYIADVIALVDAPTADVDIAKTAVRMSVVADRCGVLNSECNKQVREIAAAAAAVRQLERGQRAG